MTLVLDASVALAACGAKNGFDLFGDDQLTAPALMWSEARSVLHELAWRGELGRDDALATCRRLQSCPVERRDDVELGVTAWRVADDLGWAKTYDAEYVALALLLDCRLVTLDARLRRGADRLGRVISPGEL